MFDEKIGVQKSRETTTILSIYTLPLPAAGVVIVKRVFAFQL
jgi:hypothetical protein